MKKLLVYTVLIGVLLTSVYANSTMIEKYRDWVIDSYNFGFAGNNCSEMLYDYGIQGRSFTSESAQFIKNFFNACQIGKEDAAIGKNSLPQILNDWDSMSGGE